MDALEQKKAADIAEKTNYLNKNIIYLKNTQISEYDISAAGFSVIKSKQLLPEKTISDWEKLDKHTRTVNEGLMIRSNPKIGEVINLTLEDVRKKFVLLNDIAEEDILSIKKDAVFLIKKSPRRLLIDDYFNFRLKGQYTSYLYIGNKEIYYSGITDTLELKGFSKYAMDQIDINNSLFSDIKRIIKLGEKLNDAMLFQQLKDYRQKYLKRELPVESYRNINTGKFDMGSYSLDNIPESLKGSIDITQNYVNYLIPLFRAMI